MAAVFRGGAVLVTASSGGSAAPPWWAPWAGLLVVADGVSFVASRTALLDIFHDGVRGGRVRRAGMVDRDQVRMRLQNAWLEDRIDETLGPKAWCAVVAVRQRRSAGGPVLTRRNGRACTMIFSSA